MKSKTKAPSKIKYLKNNPSITFNLPIEIYHKINEMCESNGITKSQFLKRYYCDQVFAFDDIKAKHTTEIENVKKENFENGYQKGSIDKEKTYKQEYDKNIEDIIKTRLESRLLSIEDKAYDAGELDGKTEQVEIIREKNKIHLKCYICKKPLTIDITNGNDRKLIIDSINNTLKHVECVE